MCNTFQQLSGTLKALFEQAVNAGGQLVDGVVHLPPVLGKDYMHIAVFEPGIRMIIHHLLLNKPFTVERMFADDVERNDEELIQAIQKAIGRDDLPIEIAAKGRWDLSALVATSFTAGRVFWQVMPPILYRLQEAVLVPIQAYKTYTILPGNCTQCCLVYHLPNC